MEFVHPALDGHLKHEVSQVGDVGSMVGAVVSVGATLGPGGQGVVSHSLVLREEGDRVEMEVVWHCELLNISVKGRQG